MREMGVAGKESMFKMMNSICWFLNLIMESARDFVEVVPTLELIIWVRDIDNRTVYSFY